MYVYGQNLYGFGSVYENGLGEEYLEKRGIKSKAGYVLNLEKYQKCVNDVVRLRIFQ